MQDSGVTRLEAMRPALWGHNEMGYENFTVATLMAWSVLWGKVSAATDPTYRAIRLGIPHD